MRPGGAIRWLSAVTLLGAGAGCSSSSTSNAAMTPADGGGTSAAPAPTTTASSPAHDLTPDGYKVCARQDNPAECFACCASFFPAAEQKLLTAAAACTCAAPYCGPTTSGSLDSGANVDGANGDAADDGESKGEASAEASATSYFGGPAVYGGDADTTFPFGNGACSADMCSLTAAPSKTCVSCALGIIEGSEGAPLCADSKAQCETDSDCAQLLSCAVYCPAAGPD